MKLKYCGYEPIFNTIWGTFIHGQVKNVPKTLEKTALSLAQTPQWEIITESPGISRVVQTKFETESKFFEHKKGSKRSRKGLTNDNATR